ncbi:DUF1972 domain-containing protein [Lacticaseibacillus paracasei]|uniref:DUF1972 domain-containing protein n=1 Tax=Lacticaseibacillus paracasei TaxID=1597 RepID=UPI0034E8F0F5
MTEKRKVFIIGSKGTPAKYGGFETFVDNLVSRQNSSQIKYFIACRRDLSDNKADLYDYKKATCFNVDVPNIVAVELGHHIFDPCSKFIANLIGLTLEFSQN